MPTARSSVPLPCGPSVSGPFLHDGRTSDIVEAINQHFSEGSEANTVISDYRQLPTSDQQALVDFLRSL